MTCHNHPIQRAVSILSSVQIKLTDESPKYICMLILRSQSGNWEIVNTYIGPVSQRVLDWCLETVSESIWGLSFTGYKQKSW